MNDQVQQVRGAAPAADRGAASGDGVGAAAFPGRPAFNGLPGAGPAANAWSEYWVDRWQRSVLYWDVMRKRGHQSIEHGQRGKPPALVLDYETAIDPAARPFVVVDPRAGHGPGIGEPGRRRHARRPPGLLRELLPRRDGGGRRESRGRRGSGGR